MTESSIDVPQWPCALSDKLKGQLLDIAQPCKGIPNMMKKTGIYYMTRGLCVFYYTTEYMNNNLGLVFGAHDWVGARTIMFDPNLFFDNPRLFIQAIELEPIEYLYFPRQRVAQLAEVNYEIYKLLYFCLGNIQPVQLKAQLTAMQNKDVRVVYTLLVLAQKKQTMKGAKIAIKVTQEQLSLITGLSRPRINEVLKKIEKCHEISITRGGVCILDIIALSKRLDHSMLMFSDPRIKS